MNEIALSNDINQIELEIQHHKNIAGQSIWEIGRRLNHVKENDLVHGEFMKWLEKVQIEHTTAKRMMKVSSELPNSATLHHLGESALYLIATLPEEERDQEHVTADGDKKTPDKMTVRELQRLKVEISKKDEEIDYLKNKEPEVVEKIVEVEKEVEHPHVNDLRSDNAQLSKALKQSQTEADAATKRNEFIEKEYQSLLDERAEVDEKSEKYDQLTEAIKNAEGRLSDQQKMVSDYKDIMKILRQGNEAILTISGLTFMNISETVNGSESASREFDSLIRNLERLTRDLRNIRNENIIEGEFTNE